MMSLDAFVRHLAGLGAEVRQAEQRGLRGAAEAIKAEARDMLGTYQGAAGPFPAWAELTDATKADRARKGYTPNDPLLRSGEMRDSIETKVGDRRAAIGSNSEIAVYQELGTRNMPARPFLGPAGFKLSEDVAQAIAREVARAVAGGG